MISLPNELYSIPSCLLPGKFEPVKWSCRAPLPSGKLCPRKDREKCPFHGKIIARDNQGQPSRAQDRLAEEKREEEEKQRNPDWQDPNLLKDLEAATGIDLKMPTKKGKGEKSSNPACLLAHSPLFFRQGQRNEEQQAALLPCQHPRVGEHREETVGEENIKS